MSNKSGVAGQVISLPSGGGAMRGIGEKFSPDLHTGNGSLNIPLALPGGRNGYQPQLNVTYSSSGGNGIFGIGWAIGIPSVSRKTSKGIPVYDDSFDTFILAGSEDLVEISSASPSTTIYRPRTEGLFAQIEHHRDSKSDYWVVRARDGLVSIYGSPGLRGTDTAVIADPAHRDRIFSWKLTKSSDPFGNTITYAYERDISRTDGPHEWDQLYLAQINYINIGDELAPDYLARVTFEHKGRPDPVSDYRAGFEIRTLRRCHAIQVSTHAGAARLSRSYTFVYLDEVGSPIESLPLNGSSLLARVECRGQDGTKEEALPPATFRYTRFNPDRRNLRRVTGPDLPLTSLSGSALELADLSGDGLPDLIEMDETVRYWKNLGEGRFAPARPMSSAPAGLRLADAGVQLADADGDGRIDVLVSNSTSAGYFPLRFSGTWDERSFRRYKQAPTFSFEDPDVRLVDLDGDGVTDALRTGTTLECYFNDPQKGWHRSRRLERRALSEFPDVSFADLRVRLADMTGDGLQDIVMLHDGRIDYWPSLGHGNWGRRITMVNSPRLPQGYDPRRVLLGDLDGDGVADCAYVEDDRVTLWINSAGNRWSQPIIIHGTPPVSDMDAVRLVDLLGNGVSGILWSTDARGLSPGNWFFLDPIGGVKPYLLEEVDAHLGSVTQITYSSSTQYSIHDEQRWQTRWRTTLPFPVQVVAAMKVTDVFSGTELSSEYRYHHGHWDGAEREFRGFARVDQLDVETRGHLPATEGAAPPLETRNWFHIGPIGDEFGDWQELDLRHEYWGGDLVFLTRDAAEAALLNQLPRRARRDALRALRGRLIRSEAYGRDGSSHEGRPYSVSESLYGVTHLPVGSAWPASPASWQHRVFFSFLQAQRSTQWERGDEPLTRFSFVRAYDTFGQPQWACQLAVPRGRNFRAPAAPGEPYLATVTRTDFAQRDDSALFIVDRVSRSSAYELMNDGSLPVLALVDAAAAGTASLRLLGQSINYYDGDEFVGLPFGQLGDYGALVRTVQLAFTRSLLQSGYRSGSSVLSPPEEPVYLDPSGMSAWTAEYPAEFRSLLPPMGGYTYQPGGAGSEFVAGYFIATARKKYDFHLPAPRTVRGLVLTERDPIGRDTKIEFDKYGLLPVKVTDTAGLVSLAEYDYRTFQVAVAEDPNGNRQAFSFTPLGLLAGTFVMGRKGDAVGDREDAPGSRQTYDWRAYQDRRQPISIRTTQRVYHVQDTSIPATVRDQIIEKVEFYDGLGRLLQTRAQAEDVLFGDVSFGDSGLPADQSAPLGDAVGRRQAPGDPPFVVVSGWQLYDNKGRIVRKYESFFSEGWEYSAPADAQKGQFASLFYDPRGNLVRTKNPDGSEQRIVYGIPKGLSNPDDYDPTPWETYSYDANDNAGRTHAAGSRAYQGHWDTPSSSVIDALGRVIQTVERNGQDPSRDFIITRSRYDIQGNLIEVIDALGRSAYSYLYDLLKRPLRSQQIDAGVKRTIVDAAGKPIEGRDSKGALQMQGYDSANRPIRLWARDGADQKITLRQRLTYGDSSESGLTPKDAKDRNLIGKGYQHYDEAGVQVVERYDFKGNPLEKHRQVIADSELAKSFLGPPKDWKVDVYRVDWAPPFAGKLDAMQYRTSLIYDALNRPIELQYPQDVKGIRKKLRYTYNRAGTIQKIELDGTVYVENVAYNAKRQRILLVLGNGIMIRFAYDPFTFRLKRQRAEKYSIPTSNSYRSTGNPLQDLAYENDLAGNILAIHDRTPNCGLPINPNALDRQFSYDPIYRLLSANGRECDTPAPAAPWDDSVKCTDYTKTREYKQQYTYDATGNLSVIRHTGGGSTRLRQFKLLSNSNRISTVTDAGTDYKYQYDASGNLTDENTTRHFEWDHGDRLRAFSNQVTGKEPTIFACYLYDASGARIKKYVRTSGGTISVSVVVDGAFEHNIGAGGKNNDLHIVYGSRIASIRAGVALPGDSSPDIRYTLADHLGGVSVSMESGGTWMNREEYMPYGETSFGGYSRKKYRFAGQMRDEESGLSVHGLRYYSPWLTRWMSCDPKALADGTNNYSYSRLNPISRVDRTGSESAEAAPAASSSSSAASTSEVIGSDSAGPGLYYHPECICNHGPDNSNGPSHLGCYLNFPSETGSSTTNLPSAASAGREAVGLMTVPTNTAGEGASGTAQLYSGKAGETVNATIEASPSKNFSIKNIKGKPTPAFEEAIALHNKFTAEYGGRYPQYNSVWGGRSAKFVARASLSGHPVNPNKPTPGSIQELYEIPTLRITGTFRGQLTAIMGTLTFYSAWSAHANESSTLQKGLLDTTMGAGVADILGGIISAGGSLAKSGAIQEIGLGASRVAGPLGALAWSVYAIPKAVSEGDTDGVLFNGAMALGTLLMLTGGPLAPLGLAMVGAVALIQLSLWLGRQ